MHKLVKKKINKMIDGGSFNGAPALTNSDAIKPQVPLTAMGLGKNPIGKLANNGPTAYKPISNENSSFTSAVGTIGNIASLGNKLFSNQKDSSVTRSLDSVYDAAANAALKFGPVGTVVGGIMKVGGLANSALKSAGVGTDQLTGTDKILGSNFLALTPVGLANSIGATRLLKFTKDNDTISKVGNAYGGALSDINTAEKYSGKKVGLFSNSNKYNSKIANANLEQTKMAGIAGNATDRFTNSNNQLIGLGNMLQQSGGYNQSGTTFGKNGLKLQEGGSIAPNDAISTEKPVLPIKHKDGGSLDFARRVLSMKTGGAFNVIPIGALHKNLHHLESVDDKYKEVTSKGIPIVTENGKELQQQAEVEKEEIIFNLDVTKKLEDLRERGTDEAAIAAGKLLTKEILENTVDKAGLIKTIE